MPYHPPMLIDIEELDAFIKDWEQNVPCKDMAVIHGFANAGGVSRKAKSLGLTPRCIHPLKENPELSGGHWIVSHGIHVWITAA